MTVSTGETDLESVSCYFCGSSQGDLWGEESGYEALKCSTCGLVYVTPRPRLSEIDEAAQTGEHRTERGRFSAIGRFRASRVRAQRRAIRRTLGDIDRSQPLRWLDIGAGFGELAMAVTDLFPRAEVTAIEPNAQKRLEAARQGIALCDSSLAELPEESFDVASLMNVWSHLAHPPSFLAEVSSLLVEGGLLLVETGTGAELPDSEDYPGPLLLPDHLSFVGQQHATDLIERAGLNVESVSRYRADTLGFAATFALRRVLGRPGGFVIPYRSPLRTLRIRARRVP